MATMWITGARGFIGRHLAKKLASEGSTVIGIGHGAWPASDAALWGVSQWVNGHITGNNLQGLHSSYGLPAALFHLAGGSSVSAALANPNEDFSRTVESTAALLEWLRLVSPDTKLVAVSSAAVYGAGHLGPISEDVHGRPSSPYGYHKYIMEQLCSSYGASFQLRSVVLRLFSVYGIGLRKQLLWDICCKMQAANGVVELGGTGDELRDWIEIRDAVGALAMAPVLATSGTPVLNIGTGTATPVKNIAAMLSAAWRHRGRPAPMRFNGIARPGDPFSLQADIRRMTAHGMRCSVGLEHGISEYVRWFQTIGSGSS